MSDRKIKKANYIILILLLILGITSSIVFAFATIDSAVSKTQAEHNGSSPTVVFTSDQTGYAFYVDSNGTCVYSKTTNGGTSWGAAQTVDSQTDCEGIAVWYDQWTPGDLGTVIHVVTMDSSEDDLWYSSVDTGDNDSKTTAVNVTSGQGATLDDGVNIISITKSSSGQVFIGAIDTSDSFVFRCSTGCSTNTNWSEAGTSPFTNGDDWIILLPIADGDIIAIWWDITANAIFSREFEDTAGSWVGSNTNVTGTTTIDDNTTYDGAFAATFDPDTYDIYLVFGEDIQALGGSNDDIKAYHYNGSTWAAKTDVITNEPLGGITGVSISYDNQFDDICTLYYA